MFGHSFLHNKLYMEMLLNERRPVSPHVYIRIDGPLRLRPVDEFGSSSSNITPD